MSNSYNYLPIPPRAWSRVQNPCTYIIPDNSYNSIFIPLTNQTVSLAQALIEDKIQYKGNILQYKGNSSRLTKKQKYSKISNRLWTNRTTVHATQTQTYSNPNTSGFARINSLNIPFPNQIVGSPNNISGPYQYGIPNPNNCNTTSIEDGGSLLCGSYANPCTGEITQNVYEQQCFPTYCSDVPGQIMDLCWNPKMQTYFPKNRSTMSNSGNKFPQGYKGFVSAITPVAPVLISANVNLNTVTLIWSYTNNICIPISSFQIYQDNVLIQTVSYTINSATINNLSYNSTYSFYIVALSNNISSAPSNILTVLIEPQPTPPTPPTPTIPYIFNNNGTSAQCSENVTNNVYTLTITNGGNCYILFNVDLDIDIIVIGNGGNGANGISTPSVSGSGGGGGGIGVLNNFSVTQNNSYYMYAGISNNTSPSIFILTPNVSSTTSSIYISSTAGGNAIAAGLNPTSQPGSGGTSSIINNTTYILNSYNGGGGGYYTIIGTPVNGQDTNPTYPYSGGGGAGSNPVQITSLGGGGGYNGNGGNNGSSNNSDGEDGFSFGSGGGGGGFSVLSPNAGGTGGNGAIIITFTYVSV